MGLAVAAAAVHEAAAIGRLPVGQRQTMDGKNSRWALPAAGHTATATGFGGFGGRPCRSEVAAEDLLALPKKRVEESDEESEVEEGR